MSFGFAVRIDGQDIAPIVLEGATITYGRRSPMEQPQIPVAVVSLLTVDAYPAAADTYPEFGLGDWATALSGFVDVYSDTYAGVKSRITIGVPVEIEAGTPSGFVDEYVDEYANGVNFRRFTGRVNAIDYTPGLIQLTCTPRSEEWARLEVGGTATGVTIPQETEAARAARYATEAGIALTVDGPGTVQVIPVAAETKPAPLMQHLLDLMQNTGGVIYSDRSQWVHVQTRGYVPPAKPVVILPPETTLVDPLRMTLDIGLVRNRVTVEYGVAAVGSNARPAVTVQDSASISRYGKRDYRVATSIATLADATTYANNLLAQFAEHWSMPDAEIALGIATDAVIAAICGLDLGNRVKLPALLSGAPDPTYEAAVLGITETLSRTDWRLQVHLSPQSTTV